MGTCGKEREERKTYGGNGVAREKQTCEQMRGGGAFGKKMSIQRRLLSPAHRVEKELWALNFETKLIIT
jgi:hypothetical protein